MDKPTDPLTLNLSRLKREAKAMRKASDVKLYEALDAQAKRNGYRNWPSLVHAHDDAREIAHV
jgi:hypothetical protein